MRVYHELEPIYNKSSKVLILGSLPSVKSREVGFYYAHPQNRFWRILESLFGVSLPDIDAKRKFLLSHGIALWDTVASCEISGSSDEYRCFFIAESFCCECKMFSSFFGFIVSSYFRLFEFCFVNRKFVF